MPGKFDTLGPGQDIHTSSIKRRSERIGVQCLTPLAIGFRVTMSAIFCIRKRARLDEFISFNSRAARNRELIFAETEVIRFAYFGRVRLAIAIPAGLRLARGRNEANAPEERRNESRSPNQLGQANSLCLLKIVLSRECEAAFLTFPQSRVQ